MKLTKEFAGVAARSILSIVLVILLCTAVSGGGMLLASRYGLTRSREQVPLEALAMCREPVELPQRGAVTKGEGWTLRNSRGSYTLTLDGAAIEPEEQEGLGPALEVKGDLTVELKQGSGSRIRSEGPGIRIESGIVTITGKGSLEIEGNPALEPYAGGESPAIELVGEISVTEGSLDGASTKIIFKDNESFEKSGGNSFMKLTILCYKKCTTCQKALRWLDENGIEYETRPIKEENPGKEELKTWYERSGLPLKRFFNTSGNLYKEMGLKDKLPQMSEDEQLALLSTDGMLVKRPLAVAEDYVIPGFKEDVWKEKMVSVH